MPPGVPVATVSINGAKNAAILAVEIIALSDNTVLSQLKDFKKKIESESLAKNEKIKV